MPPPLGVWSLHFDTRSAFSSPADGDVKLTNNAGSTLANLIIGKACYDTGKTICDYAGAGSPEGVQTASIGSTRRNTTDGSFYRKTSGSGNTGWVTP
ncbi:MAG TPA: hypothetical protein VGC66_12130 [Pyrinomonadaceae bacterium]|jgi:hypothetical protein